MLKHRFRQSTLAITNGASSLMSLLLRDEAISGKFLIAAAVVALIVTNSPWSETFEKFWQQPVYVGIGDFGISETLRHWIDEGLMALFFLTIGLEVKREIIRGELSTLRAASLPIGAAIGGMIFAIGIYMALNAGHSGWHGWGIPMTTDTALALAILAFASKRIPTSLKVFLLAVMVVDDLAAIGAIAVFYGEHISLPPLLFAGGIVIVMLLLQWARLMRFSTFIILGVLLWLGVHASGVHATIAGAVMGLCAPIVPRSRKVTNHAIAERLERSLIPITTFVIIPLFALANTGVVLSTGAFGDPSMLRIGMGIIGGLIIGKSLGIIAGTWLIVKLGVTGLPQDVRWKHIVGVSLLAGIGFTLSIFIAELAFGSPEFIQPAKIAIFISSVLAGGMGLALLSTLPKRAAPTPEISEV